jgi:hypothetical protein
VAGASVAPGHLSHVTPFKRPAVIFEYLNLISRAETGDLAQVAALHSPLPGLSGLVPDLGSYVLAWAAQPPTPHVLARLEAAETFLHGTPCPVEPEHASPVCSEAFCGVEGGAHPV